MKKNKPLVYSTMKTLSTYEKQGGKCIYCLNKFVHIPGNSKCASWEHLHPKSLGGGLEEDNMALACKKCNRYRGNISIEQFLDGYILWNVNSRAQGLPDDAPSINIARKVRGPRRWYHRYIGYEVKF